MKENAIININVTIKNNIPTKILILPKSYGILANDPATTIAPIKVIINCLLASSGVIFLPNETVEVVFRKPNPILLLLFLISLNSSIKGKSLS